MSVQLIIAPQSSFTPATTTTTGGGTEFLADGQNFNTLTAATQYDPNSWGCGGWHTDAMTNGYPTIPNTWYSVRYCINNVDLEPFPEVIGNEVIFYSRENRCAYGAIYQRVTLTIGESYRIVVKNSAPSSGPSYCYVSVVTGITTYTTVSPSSNVNASVEDGAANVPASITAAPM